MVSIYIRENSLEYNQPTICPSKSMNPLSTLFCCGYSPSDLTVRDSVSVVYYDDIVMDTIRNDTRPCHGCQTFCCGGRGELVALESTFCGEMCYRGRSDMGCFCCVPICCPEWICPCGMRVSSFIEKYDFYLSFILHFSHILLNSHSLLMR